MKESNTIYNYIINSYKDSLSLQIHILMKEGDYQEVINVINHSYLHKLRQHDLYVDLLLVQAYLHSSAQNREYFGKAMDIVKRLIMKNEKNVYLANEAAVLLERTNKINSSMYVLKKIRENTLDMVSCCTNMAIVYILNEQFNEAASMLSTVLQQVVPTNRSNLYKLLAFVKMKLHHYDEAIVHLSKALIMNPADSSLWYNLVVVHLANAQSVLANVHFYHEGEFVQATNCYSCCGALANEQGCKCKSLRNPGDLSKAETSIQFALSTLATFQKNAVIVKGADIEGLLIQCKTLWTEKEKQREIDLETDRQTKAMKAALLAPTTTVQSVTSLEREREEQLRIERIVQEERARLRNTLIQLKEQEEDKGNAKPKKRKARSKTNPVVKRRDDDERVISSEDDTDDAGEEDNFANTNIFDDDDDEEDVSLKKRKRAVESSDEEEEKRPHVESQTIQEEVDGVFSDDDWIVWHKQVTANHSFCTSSK